MLLNDTEPIAGENSLPLLSEKLHAGLDSKLSEDTHRDQSSQSSQTIGSIEIEEIPFAGK